MKKERFPLIFPRFGIVVRTEGHDFSGFCCKLLQAVAGLGLRFVGS